MKKVWNQFYQKRGRFYLLPHPNFSKVTSKFTAYRVCKVLDLGCGSGRHSIELGKAGFDVTGMDFSKDAIKLAKQWVQKEDLKVDFVEGDFYKKLPFKDDCFSGVIAIDSICYDSTETMKFMLDECKRILKDGGLIFVTLPTQVGNPLVTHLIFTKEEIKKIISKNFKIIETFMDRRKYLCVFGLKR